MSQPIRKLMWLIAKNNISAHNREPSVKMAMGEWPKAGVIGPQTYNILY